MGVRFQRFATGPDQGADLLSGAWVSQGTVVQCKHYWRSGFNKLKAVLADKELPKVRKLNPKRYVIATSVALTLRNKQDLLGIFQPYCHGLDDIYGCDDFNTLLRAFPDVETTHYKLWLTSAEVLKRVLHHGSVVWNALTKADLERKMSLYVQTPAYGVALDILKKHNYCVISGIPGVGKTTLAEILVTRLMEDGFALLAVRGEIGEALEMVDVRKRQVVYYDDFLGQSSISERLGKKEDRSLIRLLREAKQARSLKVVFTTREYILQDAMRVYEPLSGPELEIAKCIVKAEDYTRGHRGRILYNHVYFSGLSRDYANALAENGAYKQIVDHKNYNPRIIEWMTMGITTPPASRFVSEFVRMLDNPLRIWEHAFEQIGADARAILLCLASIVGSMSLDELRQAWLATTQPSKEALGNIELRDRFSSAMKRIDGSFIRTERDHSTTGISFHNPSIRDYITRRIADDDGLLLELLSTASFFQQIQCLVALDANGEVQSEPTGRVGDCKQLRDAVTRTIGAPSPVLHRTMSRLGTLSFWRGSGDLGSRFSKIAGWGHVLGTSWIEFSCRLARDKSASEDVAKVATAGVCGFLNTIIQLWPPDGGAWCTLVQHLLAEIGNGMAAGGSTADEWSQWSWFLQKHPSLFSEDALTDWSEQAYDFCIDEIDNIRFNADSPSEAEGMFEPVGSIAVAWDFQLDKEKQRLDESMAEKGSGDDDEPWERGGGVERHSGPGGSDDDLDSLFGSLTDRDPP